MPGEDAARPSDGALEWERRIKEFVAAQVPDAIPTRRIISEGKIYQEILKAADAIKVDLIVMGSHRPELSDYLHTYREAP